MRTLKFGLEKPTLIWVLIAALYIGIFWTGPREAALTPSEEPAYKILEQFSESPFPPKISLVREVPDWGHLGYYALFGRVYSASKGEVARIRLAGLVVVLASLLVFVRLGFWFTYRNRLNPLWISLALMVFAANPYTWSAAFHLEYSGLLVFFLLVAMYLFEKEHLGWSAVFTSLGVLVDFRALLLALAFFLTRISGEHSRLLRPERMVAFLFPFVIAALPLLAWGGIVPQGDAREWFEAFYAKAPTIRPDGLFYSLALLPLYALVFAWAWGIRARSRALTTGAIITAVCIPLYFLFPVHFDWWDEVRNGSSTALGLVDEGALLVAGPYKNLVLFVPWLAGTFLFLQLLLMDVLDQSRWLRYFVIFFSWSSRS